MCPNMKFLILSSKVLNKNRVGEDSVKGKVGNLYLIDAKNLEQVKFENVITDNNRLVKLI